LAIVEAGMESAEFFSDAVVGGFSRSDGGKAFGGYELGGIVELYEEVTVFIAGLEIADVETLGLEVEIGVGHCG